MRERHRMLPIWFFIGILLSIYGIIIFVTSVRGWSHPSAVVLSKYHSGVWGGIVLLIIGSFYVLRFMPRRK